MYAPYVITSALLTASYAKLLVVSKTPSSSDPTITEAPRVNFELLRRQNDGRFMGWISDSAGSWSSQQCNSGLTYFETSSNWACCTTKSAGCKLKYEAIGCVSGSLIYSLASTGTEQRATYACHSIFTDPIYQTHTFCNTAYVYENMQDPAPLTRIVCGTKIENWSYYRQKPAESTPSTTTAQGMKYARSLTYINIDHIIYSFQSTEHALSDIENPNPRSYKRPNRLNNRGARPNAKQEKKSSLDCRCSVRKSGSFIVYLSIRVQSSPVSKLRD